jgi:hypothetical protein
MGYPMAAFPFLEVTLPLRTHTIRTEKVRLTADNDFEVRAITFPDLSFLVQARLPELVAIVAKYQETRADITDRKNIADLAIMAARDFPSLAVEMISACVYGELVDAEMRQKIGALPFPIQLDALSKIAKLTVEEAGGLGNLIAALRQHMTTLAGEAGPLTMTTQSV